MGSGTLAKWIQDKLEADASAAGVQPVPPAEPKNSWPELEGKAGEEVAVAIRQADPSLQVLVVPQGSMVTMDYRLDRVRVFVGQDGKVVGSPSRG